MVPVAARKTVRREARFGSAVTRRSEHERSAAHIRCRRSPPTGVNTQVRPGTTESRLKPLLVFDTELLEHLLATWACVARDFAIRSPPAEFYTALVWHHDRGALGPLRPDPILQNIE